MSKSHRPYAVVVLAMTADGKISDAGRSHPVFGSEADYARLEKVVAQSDAVFMGSGTLQAGGTAMRVQDDALIQERQQAGKPPQPIQVVCTRSGEIDRSLKFFQQSVPRQLLTTPEGAQNWQGSSHFDRIMAAEPGDRGLNWEAAYQQLHDQGIRQIAVLGGGEIIADLLKADLIDELHLTLCPLLIGGREAPTPVGGAGFTQDNAPKLTLTHLEQVGGELFLTYRVQH